jgi:hypothetical protein
MLREWYFWRRLPLSLLRVNWFNINLYFCRRGRENRRKLSKNSFIFKTDANNVEYHDFSVLV